MSLVAQLFFSVIAFAVPTFFWWAKYREKYWKNLRAVVERVEISRKFVNPAWRVTVSYEFEGVLYESDVSLYARDWPGGVVEGQKIMVRVKPSSPQHCFIETGSAKSPSGFIRCVALGFSALALIIIWTS
jgi:Protein of unknown function (DUF3592)